MLRKTERDEKGGPLHVSHLITRGFKPTGEKTLGLYHLNPVTLLASAS